MVYLIGAATALSTLIGGLFFATHVGSYLRLALSLALGLMMGVVFFDIVPESIRLAGAYNGISYAMLALVGGFILVHFIERLMHKIPDSEVDYPEAHHVPPAAVALIGHSFLDGLGIGLAFQVSNTLGALFAVAVIAHDMGDGFNSFMLTRSKTWVVADALAPLLGVIAGSSFSLPAHLLGVILGLFGGGLLYLATSHIMPQAHDDHYTNKLAVPITALGAGIMYLLIGAIG